MKKILLISDWVGNKNIALDMVNIVLTKMQYLLNKIPSIIISDVFSAKDYEICDNTSYLKKNLDLLCKNNDFYDLVFCGYLYNISQIEIIKKYLEKNKFLMILDPIFADDNKLYKNIDIEYVNELKKMLYYSDIIIPNITEAKYLSDLYLDKVILNENEIIEIIKKLEKYNLDIIITNVNVNNKYYVYTCFKGNINSYKYENLKIKFSGSGDLFSAIFVGYFLKNKEFELSVEKTILKTEEILRKTLDKNEKNLESIFIDINSILDTDLN